MYEVEQALKIIEGVRSRLEKNLNSKTHVKGCLRGAHVDEYIRPLTDELKRMKARLQVDREYLQAKIDGEERWV